MTFGVGEALSVAQFGLQIGQMIMGNRAQEQQIYNQTYSTTFNNLMGEFKAQRQNDQIVKQFSAKVDFVKNQLENNFIGAQASWISEQMRLNEVYDSAAYKSESMRKQLTQTMGAAAAREVYGKSARRGALVSTLGAYGRSRAQLVDSLMSQNVATKMRMERTQQQKKAQDKLAISQLSVTPQAATFIPSPMPTSTAPGFGEQAMGVLGAGLGAFSTGWGATPEGGDFFGIKKS